MCIYGNGGINSEESKLQKLLHTLRKHDQKNDVYNYVVPDLWNAWNYQGEEMVRTSWGELIVNPYNFYSEVIESYILPKAKENVNYNQSISQINQAYEAKPGYLGETGSKIQLFIQ